MILLSPEIMNALEKSPTTRTEAIDLDVYHDLIAGQSTITLEGRRYGVVCYERRGHMANAVLVELPS